MNTITNSISARGVIDLDRVAAKAVEFGFRRGTFSELEQGVAVAEALMQSKLATPEAIGEMDRITGMTAWVTGDPVDGIFLSLPLTPTGESAVRNGTYTPGSPDPAHLCSGGQGCSAFYIGVYAGANRDARRKVMTAAAVMRVELFSAYPCFARGATEDGRRSMDSLGFKPFDGGLPDLYVQEALDPSRWAAA
ncbi:MAG: hypothetical protein V7651_12535 [Hyphomonas oceanitis]|uniref:hypothetical protein n=1 Tax=Hyphomonas oceanitis TaxID=81033 RepID=UPI0030038011